MKALAPWLLILAGLHPASARQVEDAEATVERIADELFALQDLDLDYSELYENLLQWIAHPLDLNKATAEQLRALYILSPMQLADLLEYRSKYGPFHSIYELQTISSLDDKTIRRLIGFVTVASDRKDQPLLKRIANADNSYLILRYQRTLEDRKGYQAENGSEPAYAGSPDQYYARLRVNDPSDFSLGATLEKDAGEKWRWDPARRSYGADYVSCHFQLLNKGRLKNVIVGDFQSQFGQGLVLGGAFGVGKGGETIATTRRNNLGFLPYTSLNENSFFRGVAVTYALHPRWDISAFYSRKKIDASAITDSLGNLAGVSSLSYSGLHRTSAELENRKVNEETNIGISIGYNQGDLAAGFIAHVNDFAVPVNSAPTLYNQFYFRGEQILNVSSYLSYNWRNLALFGEAAATWNAGHAVVMGMLASLSRQLDAAVLIRNYARDFQTYYGNGFGESSTPRNESGVYWGLNCRLNSRHSLSGYADLFRFSWLRYRGYAPSDGYEWLVRYAFQPSKSVALFLQAREEVKERNLPEGFSYKTGPGTRRNYWINLDYRTSKQLSFKTRVQLSTYNLTSVQTSGLVMLQDVTLDLKKFSISGRYALFDTDDYDNRQYVYEKDVWLAYSIPAYYGRGLRAYLLLRCRLTKTIDIWLRWSQFHFTDRDTVGSGNETIAGNRRNDVKFQLRFQL